MWSLWSRPLRFNTELDAVSNLSPLYTRLVAMVVMVLMVVVIRDSPSELKSDFLTCSPS